jgi:hypothetical protein
MAAILPVGGARFLRLVILVDLSHLMRALDWIQIMMGVQDG